MQRADYLPPGWFLGKSMEEIRRIQRALGTIEPTPQEQAAKRLDIEKLDLAKPTEQPVTKIVTEPEGNGGFTIYGIDTCMDKKKYKDAVVSVTMPPEDKELAQHYAQLNNMSLSEFFRGLFAAYKQAKAERNGE